MNQFTKYQLLRKPQTIIFLFILSILFIGSSDLQAGDAHYAKIIELDKQIIPNMPSRDKLKFHFQILDEVSKIPTDAKYFIKEINQVLDITLRIVEKNQGILRHEIIPLNLLNLIINLNKQNKNLIQSEKNLELIEKISKLIITNKNIGRSYFKIGVNKEYEVSKILFNYGCYNSYIKSISAIFDKLRFNRAGFKQFLEICPIEINKVFILESKNKEVEAFLYYASRIYINYAKYELPLKVFKYLEMNSKETTIKQSSVLKQLIIYHIQRDENNYKLYLSKYKKEYPTEYKWINKIYKKFEIDKEYKNNQ